MIEDKLTGTVYIMLKDMWEQEQVPEEWRLGILCPIHKNVIDSNDL